MDPKQEQARLALILRFASQYPTTKLEPAHLAAYVEGSAGLSLTVLAEACVKAGKRSPNFFPALPLILRCARKLVAAESGIVPPEEAWEWVLEQISSSGRHADKNPNPLAKRAVAIMGGFEELGQKKVSDRNWTRKEFMAIYKSLHRQASEEAFEGQDDLQPRLGSGDLRRIGG